MRCPIKFEKLNCIGVMAAKAAIHGGLMIEAAAPPAGL